MLYGWSAINWIVRLAHLYYFGSSLNIARNPVTALFRINESSGCFATSNQPVPGLLRGVGAYQLGVSARLCLRYLISDIDGKQVISVRHCCFAECCIA